jgi:DNA (cytosine-5)-methyltransferase 1
MKNIPERRFADFFAGIGLAEMALESCGWRAVFANDIDPKKFQVYASNLPGERYRVGDVWDLSPEDIPDIELAWASFPCIDLSLAGNRAGLNGKHSSAFWGFHGILDGLGSRRPQFVVLENVMGLLRHRKGEALRQVVGALNGLGYRCDALVVDAIHFVPQSRPRLFVLGSLHAPYAPVLPGVRPSAVRPPDLVRFMLANWDLRWGFFGFAEPPTRRATVEGIIEDIPTHSAQWWDEAKTAHLVSQMSSAHVARVRGLLHCDQFRFLTVYRRVRPDGCRAEVRFDGVAGCLRTAVGGSSRQIVLRVGGGDIGARWMTPREYARLQGVPDWFGINVRTNQALHAFGDAVCVPVVQWLADNLISPLWSTVASSGTNGDQSKCAGELIGAAATARELPSLSPQSEPGSYSTASRAP